MAPLQLRLDGRIERPKVELFLDGPTRRWASATCGCSSIPIAPGFAYRAKGSRGSGRSPRTARSCCPGAGGRRSPSPRSTSPDRRARRAAGRSGRIHRAACSRRRAGSRARSASRRSAATSGSRRILPPTTSASPVRRRSRPRRADRRHDHAAEGRDHVDGSWSRAGWPVGRHEPRAAHRHRRSWSTARARSARRWPGGAACVRIRHPGQRHARPDQHHRARRARPPAADPRQPGGADQGRGRLGAGADAGALRRRPRDAVGPDRRPRPNSAPTSPAMPLQLLDIVWPRLGLGGIASGRVDYRWAGQPSGRADLRVRGLSRAGLVLSSKPIDVGLAAVLDGRRRRCARWRSATARPSAGRRRASRRWRRGRSSPS